MCDYNWSKKSECKCMEQTRSWCHRSVTLEMLFKCIFLYGFTNKYKGGVELHVL